jgi:hypothetical protein
MHLTFEETIKKRRAKKNRFGFDFFKVLPILLQHKELARFCRVGYQPAIDDLSHGLKPMLRALRFQ